MPIWQRGSAPAASAAPSGPADAAGAPSATPWLSEEDVGITLGQAVAKAVGDKADLLFGTHGQFTASGAIRFAKEGASVAVVVGKV